MIPVFHIPEDHVGFVTFIEGEVVFPNDFYFRQTVAFIDSPPILPVPPYNIFSIALKMRWSYIVF
ncbi:hypothetical protein D3C77_725890 [compost metagenome]